MRRNGSIISWCVLRGPKFFFHSGQCFPDKRVKEKKKGNGENPYGATGKSAFLFLMGSDMMMKREWVGVIEMEREKKRKGGEGRKEKEKI